MRRPWYRRRQLTPKGALYPVVNGFHATDHCDEACLGWGDSESAALEKCREMHSLHMRLAILVAAKAQPGGMH